MNSVLIKVAGQKIRIVYKWAGEKNSKHITDFNEPNKHCHHKIGIQSDDGFVWETDCWTSLAHPKFESPQDVVEMFGMLVDEARIAHDYSFEECCDEFGMNKDSISSLDSYKSMQNTLSAMITYLGITGPDDTMLSDIHVAIEEEDYEIIEQGVQITVSKPVTKQEDDLPLWIAQYILY